MKETLKTWTFLVVLSLIVSVTLTAVSAGLKGRIEQNLRMVKVRSVLDVLNVPERDGKTDAQLLALYDAKVTTPDEMPGAYLYQEDGQMEAMAFDAVGKGLWDTVKGLVAVERDGVTIRGARFYEQAETPGLGGEIGTPAFEREFVGKKIAAADHVLQIIKPGVKPVLSDTEVHGITGATLTCDAVNIILKQAIERFQESRKGQSL